MLKNCFKHDIKYQHATLEDSGYNVIAFQIGEICAKCGKVLTQSIYLFDVEEGFFNEVSSTENVFQRRASQINLKLYQGDT